MIAGQDKLGRGSAAIGLPVTLAIPRKTCWEANMMLSTPIIAARITAAAVATNRRSVRAE